MGNSDFNILASLRSNDEAGLQELFHTYYRPLCVYCIKFVDDMHVAEDIVQELFIRFWEQKKYEQVGMSLRSYLFTSVRNRAINYLKQQKDHSSDYLQLLEKEFSFEMLDSDEIVEKKKKLEDEIARLPEQRQKVLKKIIYEQKKYKEVAKDLNISVNTVKTHFSKALKHLRGSIDIIVLILLS